ncbi:hypothetical protein AB1Y20_017197 [Prymnesium parvum]|uniref:Uncharacterized protein n=1 Tax=Prymnesium parvum TaxID=97485 RepID=A0AB34ICF8_PRYPA
MTSQAMACNPAKRLLTQYNFKYFLEAGTHCAHTVLDQLRQAFLSTKAVPSPALDFNLSDFHDLSLTDPEHYDPSLAYHFRRELRPQAMTTNAWRPSSPSYDSHDILRDTDSPDMSEAEFDWVVSALDPLDVSPPSPPASP